MEWEARHLAARFTVPVLASKACSGSFGRFSIAAVGLPLYGKGFAVSTPYASTKGAATGGRVPRGGGYSNIAKLIQDDGWKRHWDEETKNPWALAPDGSAVIGYDDVESISLKTEWAMRQGFRGVFFWQVGGDQMPDGTFPLQEAARKKLNEIPKNAGKN